MITHSCLPSVSEVDASVSTSQRNICLQLCLTFLWVSLLLCSQWRVSPQPAQGPHGLLVHRRQLRHRLPFPPGRPENRPADAGRPPHAQRPRHGPRWPCHRGRLSPGPPLTEAGVGLAGGRCCLRMEVKEMEPGGIVGGPKWRCMERVLPVPSLKRVNDWITVGTIFIVTSHYFLNKTLNFAFKCPVLICCNWIRRAEEVQQ